MWGRIIPVLISLSNTNKRTIAHINGNQQFFSILCRYSALSQNHGISINIIMNGCKFFFYFQLHSFHQFIHHCFAVQYCKVLYQLHIMNIIFHKRAFAISKVFWDFCLYLRFQRKQCLLYFLFSAVFLIFLN